MKSFRNHFNEVKDTHCSDKCCGADVKAEDCDCPADCAHCNCNAKNEAFDPKHPKVVAARKAVKNGTYNGNMDTNGNAIVHIDGKPHTVTKGDPAAKNEATNEDIIAIINEHNITLEQLENMTEEELNELLGKAIGGVAKVIGGVAKGAGRLAGAGIKRAVMTKQGSIRGTKAAKQDKAGDRAEKMAREREKEFKRKKRISDMKQRASDLDQKISDLNNK